MSAATTAAAAAPRPAYDAIVVGGSSGGVEALVALLPALPATLQAPLVVVLHLPRDRRSLLADIFRQRCALPLQEAGDKDELQPGNVYFAPPDYHLLLDEGPRLSLSVDAPVHFSRPSIDVLFESAADLYGPRLVGILLSGANEDGARGLAAIRSAGGLAIVQDPASAPMPAMPLAALASTPVDHTLPPAGIAALLAQLHQQSLL
ncbi:chemotaxis protein CheB [Acidovorax sp. Leaf76]|uniref:chemotaxis protein CheB n=1 Tax=unclassified Acidovorax TaxID=2684926 RepID=UPI0006FA37E6|nr:MULTISPECIES: chemotaxis protein CheB [unclassified Acidovorax]KQO13998.1 chemotaxis protein CheB [Acidovorax sp. Leaf76]KQO31518.1 chemotaxis protein CheB [Acidovorax sp. Leaf84]KQS27538.1 chemotaxis protein CheB [Acidovorax sp. Leaf191]